MLKTQLVEVSGAKRDPFPSPRQKKKRARDVCAQQQPLSALHARADDPARHPPHLPKRALGHFKLRALARARAEGHRSSALPPKGRVSASIASRTSFFMMCYNSFSRFCLSWGWWCCFIFWAPTTITIITTWVLFIVGLAVLLHELLPHGFSLFYRGAGGAAS